MHFTANGSKLDYTFIDFCDWTSNNRRNKPVLQMLMEYLVGRNLSCVRETNKAVGDGIFSIQRLFNGKSVAVRTASYVESLSQDHPDWIAFDISGDTIPDVFVFCVNRSMDAFSIPTNLDVWDFYVLPGPILAQFKLADLITLPALLLLQPVQCDFNGIPQAVESV